MFALVFGINFTLWGAIGFLRIVDSALDRIRRLPRNPGSAAHRARRADLIVQAAAPGGRAGPALASDGGRILGVADLAVLMAAHNEEVVIDDSLAAITALVPPENVHVVSDASTDNTVALARRHGVNVIETATNVGKAGALEEGIRTFGLVERFSVVVLLDADTRLDPGYFQAALPLFDDPHIDAAAAEVRPDLAVDQRHPHRARLRQHVSHDRPPGHHDQPARPGHRRLQHDLRGLPEAPGPGGLHGWRQGRHPGPGYGP